MSILSNLIILATEGGIPASSPWAKLAVPIGIVLFVGPVYMLLRSNLGTRLGYLVMATSLWGSTFLFALFWTFGAPGTPAFTGPQNLPGQELNEYLAKWIPLAEDAQAVTKDDSPYAVIGGYPNGFDATQPDDLTDELLDTGTQEIKTFFSSLSDPYFPIVDGLAEPVNVEFARATNDRPIVAVTYAKTCQLDGDGNLPEGCAEIGDVAPEGSDARGEDVVLFGFYDFGFEAFPSYLMLGASFILFALHMVLLARDEGRAKREREAEAEETVEVEQKATVSA